jgi:transcriptional antiterminator NusG
MYLPLFPGYLFVHTEMNPLTYLAILKTDSVVRVLCSDNKPAPIPDEQIHAIQILIKNGIAVTPIPYLREGIRVRVINGPLIGVEGIFLKAKPNKHRFVLSLDLLQESVSVEIDELDIEPIHMQ